VSLVKLLNLIININSHEMVSKHSEDFQIALRQWLVKKLDNEEFYGLRWLDYTERIYFRIPWNKMEKDPHWVKEFELFRVSFS